MIETKGAYRTGVEKWRREASCDDGLKLSRRSLRVKNRLLSKYNSIGVVEGRSDDTIVKLESKHVEGGAEGRGAGI